MKFQFTTPDSRAFLLQLSSACFREVWPEGDTQGASTLGLQGGLIPSSYADGF